MAVGAVSALATGGLFDRHGGRVLLLVPFVVAAVPSLVFASHLFPVLAGVVLWGAAIGIQDSTVKAYVADLIPGVRRATAYGVFAAVQGLGALAGGGLAGALATHHPGMLTAVVGILQVGALLLIAATLRTIRRASVAIEPHRASSSTASSRILHLRFLSSRECVFRTLHRRFGATLCRVCRTTAQSMHSGVGSMSQLLRRAGTDLEGARHPGKLVE